MPQLYNKSTATNRRLPSPQGEILQELLLHLKGWERIFVSQLLNQKAISITQLPKLNKILTERGFLPLTGGENNA